MLALWMYYEKKVYLERVATTPNESTTSDRPDGR